jgi:peptidyl-prolyl cis-trans isomerase D
MLKALRQATKSWVMKVILFLLAATFVVYFGDSYVGSGGGGGSGAVVEVGDVDFNGFEISREFGRRVQQAQANPQLAGLTQEQAIQLGLLDQTISQIVTRTLFDLAARDLGLTASDADASAYVRQVPQFQNSAGRFDRIQFENFLRASNLSEQQYIEQLRSDLVRNQLIGTLNAGIASPQLLVDRFYRYNAERRIVELVDIAAAGMTGIDAPNETQIASYYDENKAIFETPEYRSGTLASLSPENFAQEIGVPEEDIVAAYDANSERFNDPERRHILSALFASQDAAASAAKRIRAGEEFASVVEEATGQPPVDLGLIGRSEAPIEEIDDAAFALQKPGLSDPAASPFGWNLVNVTEIQPRVERTLEDVREDLRLSLAIERAREGIFDVLDTFEDALAGGASLADAASESGLRIETIPSVARSGETPTGDRADYDRIVLATLFSTEMGQSSRVVEHDDGGFFAVKVDNVEPPRIPPLADVRDRVVTAWLNEQRQAAAERTGTEIAEQARSSGSLVAAAAKAGFETTTTEPFDRTGGTADFPAEAIERVFEARPGEIVVASTDHGVAVVRLVEIVAPPTDGTERSQLRGAIAQSIASDLQVQLANALRIRYGVEIDERALQNLFSTQ